MAIYYADGFNESVALDALQEDISPTFQVTLTNITLNAPEQRDLMRSITPDSVITPPVGGGDLIALLKIPKGAQALSWWIDVPSLAGAVFALGDDVEEPNTTNQPSDIPPAIAANPVRYCIPILSGTGQPVSSTQQGVPVAGSLPFVYLGDSVLTLTVLAGTEGPVTDVIRGWFRYNMLGKVF